MLKQSILKKASEEINLIKMANQKGFRILNFKIWGIEEHRRFENLDWQFSNTKISTNSLPFVTLIIGANATGKSRLLRILVDVFNDLF